MKKTNEQLFEEWFIPYKLPQQSSITQNCEAAFLACAEIKDKEIEELKFKYEDLKKNFEERFKDAVLGHITRMQSRDSEAVNLLREATELVKRNHLDWMDKNQQQLTKILGGE